MTDTEALSAAIRELGERPSGLPASLNPTIARLLMLWAEVVRKHGEEVLLNADGPEIVALARHIIGRRADACPVCTGIDGDHQIGCQPPEAQL